MLCTQQLPLELTEKLARRKALEALELLLKKPRLRNDKAHRHTDFLKESLLICRGFRSAGLTNKAERSAWVFKPQINGSLFMSQVSGVVTSAITAAWDEGRTAAPLLVKSQLLCGRVEHQPFIQNLIALFDAAGVYGVEALTQMQDSLFGDEAITLMLTINGNIVGAVSGKLLQMLSGYFTMYITLLGRASGYIAATATAESLMAFALTELTRLVILLSKSNPERKAGCSGLMTQSVGWSYACSKGIIIKKKGLHAACPYPCPRPCPSPMPLTAANL